MEDNRFQKIVWFDTYCKQCKYKNYDESQNPCYECLQTPARTDGSHKPVLFKEKEKKK